MIDAALRAELDELLRPAVPPRYSEVGSAAIPARHWWLARRWARLAAKALGIEVPIVRWYGERGRESVFAWLHGREPEGVGHAGPALGLHHRATPGVVWLLSSQPEQEVAETAAHEVYHCWEAATGRTVNEEMARSWARAFLLSADEV
jgi:hypothetical protein